MSAARVDLPETYLRAFSDFEWRTENERDVTRADVYSFPQIADTARSVGSLSRKRKRK